MNQLVVVVVVVVVEVVEEDPPLELLERIDAGVPDHSLVHRRVLVVVPLGTGRREPEDVLRAGNVWNR